MGFAHARAGGLLTHELQDVEWPNLGGRRTIRAIAGRRSFAEANWQGAGQGGAADEYAKLHSILPKHAGQAAYGYGRVTAIGHKWGIVAQFRGVG
jgi:hypothetical protein